MLHSEWVRLEISMLLAADSSGDGKRRTGQIAGGLPSACVGGKPRSLDLTATEYVLWFQFLWPDLAGFGRTGFFGRGLIDQIIQRQAELDLEHLSKPVLRRTGRLLSSPIHQFHRQRT
jgi:hypothetical protein